MRIIYNITGPERKELCNTLGNFLGETPVYQRAPTYAFKIGEYTVDRNGNVECPDADSLEHMREIVDKLKRENYSPVEVEIGSLTISLPRDIFTDDSLERLKIIVGNKVELFKKAFRTDTVEIDTESEPDKVKFPWFTLHDTDGESFAYSHFVSALGKMARDQKRVAVKPYEGGNDKFNMRLFCVRLGMIGPKFKEARKIIMRYLTGNSAWKNGH